MAYFNPMAMDQNDEQRLRAIAEELAKVAKENAVKESKPQWQGNVTALYQLLGIAVIVVGLIGFLIDSRSTQNSQQRDIMELREQFRELSTQVRTLERFIDQNIRK